MLKSRQEFWWNSWVEASDDHSAEQQPLAARSLEGQYENTCESNTAAYEKELAIKVKVEEEEGPAAETDLAYSFFGE